MSGSRRTHKSLNYRRAQSATELAIFGAILMFVIGIMVRQAHNANISQGQTYRAMRMALTKSYLSSLAQRPDRNTATVLIVEDRLSPGAEKYGPTSRFPVVISGSGSLSREFMMPQDYGVQSELPRLDMYINGVFFPFTVAGYKTVPNLGQPPVNWPVGANWPEWDPQCASRTVYNGTNTSTLQLMGCSRFYLIVPNFVADPDKNRFCCQDQGSCSGNGPGTPGPDYDCLDASNRCCDSTNLNVERRFDLDRDPGTNPPEQTALTPVPFDPIDPLPLLSRAHFAWQWYLVKGFDPGRSQGTDNQYNGTNWVTVNVPFTIHLNYGAPLVVYNNEDDQGKNKNTFLDADGDFKEEAVLEGDYNGSGVLTTLRIIDNQEGDIDGTYNKLSTGPSPGLQDDLQMFSFTQDGTLLHINEGKLFQAGGSPFQWIRSTQKRNRVDIVQRLIQLSHNTGRFCNGMVPQGNVDGGPNPVEVCSDNCFSAANSDKTCYNVVNNIIFIRSRISDKGGTRWTTRVDP